MLRNKNRVVKAVVAAVVGGLFLGATPSSKATVFVTAPAGLGTTNSLDWGSVVPDGTQVNVPLVATIAPGLAVTVTTPGGTYLQGYTEGTDWTGDFNSGDHLLYTPSGSGSLMTLTFTKPVQGVGMYIQANQFGAFTAYAYNSVGTLIGQESATNTPVEGTAPYLGLLDTTADISSVSYTITGSSVGYAVDTLNVNAGSTVPEPASLGLMGLCGFGILGKRRRAHRA